MVYDVDASAAYVCQEPQSLGVCEVEDLLELLGNTDLQAITALSNGSRQSQQQLQLGLPHNLPSQTERHDAEWHGSLS